MIDFDSYIRSGEPERAERARNWSVAIGLQDVDGLKTSEYLADVAKRNIEGELPTDRVPELVAEYYRKLASQETVNTGVEEADRAAANINKLLAEPSFTFSVAGLASINRRIFDGVFKHAGQFRDYDITKKEWILRGATVTYGMASELKATVEYDLDREKQFHYKGLSEQDIIAHIARFIADLWQIHPFGEGNTRATAVFLIKYLRSKGYTLNNEPFKQHSWYFRNALVRANYSNIREGISQKYVFLERFLSNILLSTDYPLKNRFMHLDYKAKNSNITSGKENTMSPNNMEITQKTYWSKTSIVVTVLVGALLAAVIYFIESVSTVAVILLLLILIATCVTALMFMPVEVRLSYEPRRRTAEHGGSLTVKFPGRCKDFPRSEIVEAVPFTDTKRMWRLCGSGAFFGWWGWFSAKGVGKFMMYASNLDHLLLIRLRNGKQYVISCGDENTLSQELQR